MATPGLLRIDAHQHFWNYSREEYGWIDESMSLLARDFGPEDLAPNLRASGIDASIAVQARTDESENDFLLGLADRHSWIAGVVGWLDLAAPALSDRLDRAKDTEKLVGFREVLQGEPEEKFLNPAFLSGLRLLGERRFAYDILVYASQLEAAAELVRRARPDQRLVLDHLGKPDIRGGGFASWAPRIRALAKDHPNLHCKLSGMVTEAAAGWSEATFWPYMDTVLEAFGSKRVMFGSDWPVCLLNARDYSAVHDLVAAFVSGLDVEARSDILGGNAMRFYGLTTPRN